MGRFLVHGCLLLDGVGLGLTGSIYIIGIGFNGGILLRGSIRVFRSVVKSFSCVGCGSFMDRASVKGFYSIKPFYVVNVKGRPSHSFMDASPCLCVGKSFLPGSLCSRSPGIGVKGSI